MVNHSVCPKCNLLQGQFKIPVSRNVLQNIAPLTEFKKKVAEAKHLRKLERDKELELKKSTLPPGAVLKDRRKERAINAIARIKRGSKR
jgi:hypothetical protein